ncbi:hypothetical protein FWK35_00008068 [Aphis craccivora]|uniref:Uncharacterized protein n=1 Tax=Aphis craccivora TaxID=307492 RepID=A0A6G0YLE3_APHCR|nr:hypothetical protein FWK35_00008068 [Aphis craccivora]
MGSVLLRGRHTHMCCLCLTHTRHSKFSFIGISCMLLVLI